MALKIMQSENKLVSG